MTDVEKRPWWPIQSPTKKKEESERLRGERNRIKFIDIGFESRASCRIQERKKGARRSINCTFLG